MTAFSFTDDDLRAAAAIVSDAMLDALPDPSEIHIDFSPDFIRKMDALCAKARRRVLFRAVLRRVAVLVLVALLGLGTWLAVDTEARAALSKWMRVHRL